MKNVLVCTMMMLIGLQSSAEPTVTTGNPRNPLQIEVVRVQRGNGYYEMKDAKERRRVGFEFDGTTCSFYLYSSVGVQISKEVFESPRFCTSARAAFSVVSVENPVRLTIDRTTLKILNIFSPVDPLAMSELDGNAG